MQCTCCTPAFGVLECSVIASYKLPSPNLVLLRNRELISAQFVHTLHTTLPYNL